MEKVITAHPLQGTGIDSASKFFEGLGWHIYRVWSTDWYRNRAESEKRLIKAVENAKNLKPIVSDTKQRSVEDIVEDKLKMNMNLHTNRNCIIQKDQILPQMNYLLR